MPSQREAAQNSAPGSAEWIVLPQECAIRLHSDDLIRTVLDRRRPLRILAQRKTRYAEDGSLLLDSAGIGQDKTSPIVQRKEVKVSKGIQGHDSKTARGVRIA
jgi:hypothetical protein